MNRQVEFRGYDEACGLWRYGSLLVDGWLTYIGQIIQGKIVRWRVNPKSVGQYTGLKDKSGVEIYEGDIIRIRWKDTLTRTLHEQAKVVCFKNGTFNINFTTKGERKLAQRQIEVIGNIHDNPELLKEYESK